MRYYKICILGLALALSSCGAQKVATQSSTPIEEQVTSRPTTILFSDASTNVVRRAKPSPVVEKQTPVKTVPITKIAPPQPRPSKTTFTAVQSANVRVPGINPMPASGELELDLSLLQHDFCYPYHGKVISNYGRRGRSMHTGVDIKAIPGDTVRAIMGGVVRMSKYYSGYGNLIVVQHDCGIETVYGHQIKNLVQPNDVVSAGDAIGLAGRTGRATTEHVHFEVRVAGEHIDPSKLLDYDQMTLREGGLYIKNSGGRLVASNTRSGSIPMTDLQPAVKTSQPELASDVTASASSSSTAAAASKSGSTGSVKPSSSSNRSSATAYHVVGRGDTLSAIARKYTTSVADLCKINNINKNGVLSLGQRIKIK